MSTAANPLPSKPAPAQLAVHGWTWRSRYADRPASGRVRVRAEEWYLARTRGVETAASGAIALRLLLLRRGMVVEERYVDFHPLPGHAGPGEHVAWFQTPPGTTHVQWVATPPAEAQMLAEPTLGHVAERDPKCHPLAAPPRWSTLRPPLPLERVVLPEDLRDLGPLISNRPVQWVPVVPGRGDLRQLARSSVCVISPKWVAGLNLALRDLEALAASGWVIVDLATLVELEQRAGTPAELVTHAARDGLMSARVEFADLPTRGFALQDVFPYSVIDERGRFAVRALRARRTWRRHADEVGFATLLACETPWARRHGDALSLARPIDGGELMATDLPWLVAGRRGPLVAPEIAAHALRMHFGEPLEDGVQYWNRWRDWDVLVRDIADLGVRFPELRPVRWRSLEGNVAHLGLRLAPRSGRPMRELLIQTGRIDDRALHDGLPPEPMMIWLKFLAREAREQTAWARQYLSGRAVTWQFDTAVGLKYAAQYLAAPEFETPPDCVQVRNAARDGVVSPLHTDRQVISLAEDEGIFGDGAFRVLRTLAAQLRGHIEAAVMPH